jgi:hypothetical protein
MNPSFQGNRTDPLSADVSDAARSRAYRRQMDRIDRWPSCRGHQAIWRAAAGIGWHLAEDADAGVARARARWAREAAGVRDGAAEGGVLANPGRAHPDRSPRTYQELGHRARVYGAGGTTSLRHRVIRCWTMTCRPVAAPGYGAWAAPANLGALSDDRMHVTFGWFEGPLHPGCSSLRTVKSPAEKGCQVEELGATSPPPR